jgi:hypothetical protein
MRRESPLTVAVVVGCVLLWTAVAPVAAHINHVAVDDQRSDDGTIHVEWEFVGVDGWVVVRADDGGEPGAVLGHRRTTDTGFQTGTTVAIDEAAWNATTGSRDVWVVLHREERNDGFDIEDDPMLQTFGEPAGTQLTVEKAERAASVTAESFSPQQPEDGAVRVRRAELPEAGYLAVHPVDAEIAAEANDSDVGAPVGWVALSAGVHRNVSVEVDESVVPGSEGPQLLEAAVYRGEDGFEAATTRRLTAGEKPVTTTFGAEFPGGSGATPSPTPAESAVVTTPPPTETEGPTPTPTPSGGDGDAAGALAAGLALGAALLAARRRC